MTAVAILCDREGLAWSPRRITLSTVGLVPEIYRLAQDRPGLKLAVSLHGTTNQKRAELIPIAQVYTLDHLFEALQYYRERESRRISFEYLLIRGINDGLRDAQRLVERLRGEIKFGSAEELATQIGKDVEQARALLREALAGVAKDG